MRGNYLTLDEARELIPGRPCKATMWNWCRRGCARRGAVVKLGFVRMGMLMFTTREAIERFQADLAAADEAEAV